MVKSKKINVGISIGDPNGIGIEVMLKALSDRTSNDNCNYIIYSSYELVINQKKTLTANYQHLKRQGRIDAWTWKKGQPNKPHIFWDSDVAKWIEAVSYHLANKRNRSLEMKVDHVVDIMANAQLKNCLLYTSDAADD